MPVSEKTYKAVALEDPEGQWELHCGILRQKPGMSFAHSHVITEVFTSLIQQLDSREYAVRTNHARVRHSAQSYYIPDVVVIPAELVRRELSLRPDALEVYDVPLPLVVEVWSPSTGDFDVESKVPEYQQRGDREIWRIHPYERTLTAWRRQPDGSYTETLYRGGSVQPIALPNVTIDLDALFA